MPESLFVPIELLTRMSRQYSNSKNQAPGGKASAVFVGASDDMKGHIFDYGSKDDALTFNETRKHMANVYGASMGGHIRCLIENLVDIEPAAPARPNNEVDFMGVPGDIYRSLLPGHAKELTAYRDNKHKLYSVIWGQSTSRLQQKVESSQGFTAVRAGLNALGLLLAIQSIVLRVEAHDNVGLALIEATKLFEAFRQTPQMDIATYFDKYQTHVRMFEAAGGEPGNVTVMIRKCFAAMSPPVLPETATGAQVNAARAAAREEYLAIDFIKKANMVIYGKVFEELQNGLLVGVDSFPVTLGDAYYLLSRRRDDPKNVTNALASESGVAFFTQQQSKLKQQQGKGKGGGNGKPAAKQGKPQGKSQGNGKRDPVPGLGQATCDSKWVDKECFHCHNLGHPRDKCPFVKGDISAATLHSELEDEI